MSVFGKLNIADFGKGLLMAIGTAVLTIVYNTVQAGSLTFDWKAILGAAIAAAATYLSKNLVTNSNNQLLTKEQPK